MNNRRLKEFHIFAAKMDGAINEAKKLVEKGIELPKEYEHMKQFFNEIPWRKDFKVLNRIRQAARRAARNERDRLDKKGIETLRAAKQKLESMAGHPVKNIKIISNRKDKKRIKKYMRLLRNEKT